MSQSDNTYNQIIDILEAALVAAVTLGVVYTAVRMTIEALEPGEDKDGVPYVGYKMKSDDTDYLLSIQDEWKDDLQREVESYVRNQTNGELVVKYVHINSGSIDFWVGLGLAATGVILHHTLTKEDVEYYTTLGSNLASFHEPIVKIIEKYRNK